MRHYGVVHRRPGEYNHIVRNMLGQLQAKMQTTNQCFGSWTRELANGTRITVSIIKNGPVPIYRSHVAELLATVILTTFQESGLAKFYYNPPDPLLREIYYPASLVAAVGASEGAWLDWTNETRKPFFFQSRTYTPGMDSLGVPESEFNEMASGNYNQLTGKARLLWQARVGVESVPYINGEYEVVSSEAPF